MNKWPDSFDFQGFNEPIGEEWSAQNLDVEGSIPAEINGAFFRAGADPAFYPTVEKDTYLSGDGVVSRFLIQNGKVDFALKYVNTARHQAEVAAGHALFGAYHNPYTDDPSVAGVDRTTANTTPIWHAGRLFLSKEDGHSYEVNPHTLETIGSWTYGGKLRTLTTSAHPRFDPETGEMFIHGYEASGPASKDVALCVIDRNGNVVSEEWFEAPYCAMLHDFVLTKNWALFPIFPTIADLDRMKAGGPAWVHHQDLPSWVAIMPRYGKGSEVRWVKGPNGLSGYHMMNGYEEEKDGTTLLHIDQNVMETNIFPFVREASGIDASPADIRAALVRWTIDLNNLDAGWVETPLGPPGDMSRTALKDQARPYEIGYYACYDPEVGPPITHSVVGAGFNTLIRVNVQNGEITALPLGPDRSINEPVHIPSQEAGHEGWLAAVVDTHSTMTSELWFIEAGDPGKGAIAKVKLGRRLRPQIHGTWVEKDDLDKSIHQ
ncbi:MAG: carotenoid oxygenase family protein [Sphingobium sp.]|nr:carotenoid oxygenase family protein [Sphingobium sp.]